MGLNKFTVQKSFVISAGAGSGKTYTLSRRYINALVGFDYFRENYGTQKSYFENLKCATVNQIVTITYTEAAALEMKGRIFELISKIINFNSLSNQDDDYKSIQEANKNLSEDESKYSIKTLSKAYEDSPNARISTIHSYCLDLIKSNSDIARIDSKLDIIREDEKSKFLSQIIFDVLNTKESISLDISKDINMFFINNLISKYVSDAKFRDDYNNFGKDSISQEEYKNLIAELYPLPDTLEAQDELCDDKTRLEWFQRYQENFKNFEAKLWKDLKETAAPSLGVKKFPYTDDIKKRMDKLVPFYLEIDTEKEKLFFEKVEKIKSILKEIKRQYDEKLVLENKIDFDTIISKTLEIIPEIKTDFRYIMVDEFQDTNTTQFEIIKKSRSKDTNLFIVGDSKQSIYSFQGAQIEVFNNAISDKTIFDLENPINMNENHRSDGVILDNVNKIFDTLLKKRDKLKLISQNFEAEAQELKVYKQERKEKGSFEFLITSQPYEEEQNELDAIAQFISDIKDRKIKKYTHISELISNNNKAIAIVFDSSTRMLELKHKLRKRGVTAKVSTSDNFYYTKEVNDIYSVLRTIDILSKKNNLSGLTKFEKYYVIGAMRSNIIKISDNDIKKYFDANTMPDTLKHYIKISKEQTLSELVKYIYDSSNIFGIYAHYEDVEQRVANLYKFLRICIDYQNSNESNLYKFLMLIENAIYFSDNKDDEAFFKSDNTKSVEICSIHSTKGLSYPLVLLANSEKGLYSQITSDSLKNNNFTFKGKNVQIVGFQIKGYQPLSLRVLKEIDKLKHLAEKKRVLYVALTRAKNDVVISAQLRQKKNGEVSLREDSYLSMILSALGISKESLFDGGITPLSEENMEAINHIEYTQHSYKKIDFQDKDTLTATNNIYTFDESSAMVGTVVHRIIELYWNSFNDHKDTILDKMGIFEKEQRETIINHLDNFYNSDVYDILNSGINHTFEQEFNIDGKTGFIDLMYQDTDGWVIVDFKTGAFNEEKSVHYQKQLDFYKNVMSDLGYNIIDTRLLWI